MKKLIEKYPKKSIELLKSMKLIRLTEETIAKRYSEWKMRCPTHLCSGQEAVSAAVGAAVTPKDFFVSGHRAHGHYLAKGGNLKKMIAEIYGKASGCSSGKGGSMHLIDKTVGFMGSTAIVGGTIPIGVGLALSIKLQASKQVSCIFLGDGAIEEGVFYESVNFAVLKKLPVLLKRDLSNSVISSFVIKLFLIIRSSKKGIGSLSFQQRYSSLDRYPRSLSKFGPQCSRHL